ncbi:MAG TPA: hypothetical protein VM103_00480 [Candidatus Paceibacterota bacterium]|nr:hypothetical protein [Candidatus Paceibacterota bacterium]
MASHQQFVTPFSNEEVYNILPALRGRKEELVKYLCKLATEVNQHMKDTGLEFKEACNDVFSKMNIDLSRERGKKLLRATSRMLNRRSVEKSQRRARGKTKRRSPQKRRKQTIAPPSVPPKQIIPFGATKKLSSRAERMLFGESVGQKRLF